MDWKEKVIQSIKDCGQSLIDNAENIMNYEYIRDITITCHVDQGDEGPYVDVDISFYPEKFIEKMFIN